MNVCMCKLKRVVPKSVKGPLRPRKSFVVATD